jgi:hypothetical protein
LSQVDQNPVQYMSIAMENMSRSLGIWPWASIRTGDLRGQRFLWKALVFSSMTNWIWAAEKGDKTKMLPTSRCWTRLAMNHSRLQGRFDCLFVEITGWNLVHKGTNRTKLRICCFVYMRYMLG